MNYDEFYKGIEFKGANEIVRFKVEYAQNNETVTINEKQNIKEDNSSLRKNQETETGIKKNINNKKLKNDISNSNKITNAVAKTTTSIVTTTSAITAGIVAVTAISVLVAKPPTIDIISFDVGNNYLEYEIEINDLTDGIKYQIEIDDNNSYHYERQIESTGVFKEKVDNLEPDTYYTYKFVGYDETNTSSVYYEDSFYTKDEVVKLEYLATFNKPSLAECEIVWTYEYDEENDLYNDIYRIIVPTKFKNESNNNYQYRVTLFNDDGLNEVYEGIKPEIMFEIPNTYTSAKLKYESLIIKNDEKLVHETYLTDEFIFEKNFKIKEIGIDYTVSSAYVFLDFNAPDTYEVKYYTSNDSQIYSLYGNGKNFLSYPEGETTYYFYMVNENQEVISDTIEYTLNTIETIDFEYTYLNPADITITFNDNGTFNAYMETQFACDDNDVYYELLLTDEWHTNVNAITQNNYLAIEDFTYYESKGVTYNVFKMIDGIKHCFTSVTPSGTLECIMEPTNHIQAYIDTSSSISIFNFTHYDRFKFDLSSVYLILDNGDRIDVKEELFIKDEYDCYSLSLELPEGVTSCELHLLGSSLYNDYDKLVSNSGMNIKGNCYTNVVIDL